MCINNHPLISQLLYTLEGRKRLAKAMLQPLRTTLNCPTFLVCA